MELEKLRLAVEGLYRAGRWVARGVPAEAAAKLWEEVRDAAGLEAGQSQGAKPGEDEMHEANNLVNGDRQAAYGSPRPAYDAMAQVWSGLLAHKLTAPLTAEEAVILLAGMKLCREARKHKRDNVVDLHGYGLVLSHVIADQPSGDAK